MHYVTSAGPSGLFAHPRGGARGGVAAAAGATVPQQQHHHVDPLTRPALGASSRSEKQLVRREDVVRNDLVTSPLSRNGHLPSSSSATSARMS